MNGSLLALALIAAALPSWCDPIMAGPAGRLRPPRRVPARVLFGSDDVLIGYGSAPRVGERYLLLDDDGVLGRAELLAVSHEHPDGPPEDHARFRVEGSRSHLEGWWGVAVGPLTADMTIGRVLAPAEHERSGLPEHLADPILAVDLDGDELVDLAVIGVACAPETSERLGGDLACQQVWARAGAAWLQVDEMRLPIGD